MRVDPQRTYSILTGDVVGSSKLPVAERRRLATALERLGKDLARVHPTDVPLGLEVFRGDAWQLLVTAPERALRIALEVRAALRVQLASVVDTRVGIGVGTIRFLPARSVSGGDGPAYVAAGDALDGLGSFERIALAHGVGSAVMPAASALRALLATTDALAQEWTRGQARAALGALRGETQEMTGERWEPTPISQQAVAQHLARGRWHAIELALVAFEAPGWLAGVAQARGVVPARNKRKSL